MIGGALYYNHGIIVKLFANDVKVYFFEIVNATDFEKLQGALDSIVEWVSVRQLHYLLANAMCRPYSEL